MKGKKVSDSGKNKVTDHLLRIRLFHMKHSLHESISILFTLSRLSSSGTSSTVTFFTVFEGVALALEIGVVLAEGGELEDAAVPFFFSFLDFFLFPSSPEMMNIII